MAVVKISRADQRLIEELQHRQDHHAVALGVLEHEFLRERAKLLDVAVLGSPDLLRFGALHWEHYQRQAFLYEKVRQTEHQQREAGEGALRSAGVDPAQGDYTVINGVVMVLSDGRWLPLER